MAKWRDKKRRKQKDEKGPSSDVVRGVDWPRLVREGIEERDRYLKHVRALVEQYVGRYYKGGLKSQDLLANHPAELVALLVPQLASSIPFAKVSAAEAGVPPAEALIRQSLLNKWMVATDFRALQEELVTNYCFFNHIWYVGMQKRFPSEADSGDPVEMPMAVSLDWEDFVWHAPARRITTAFFRGHRVCMSRRELLRRCEDHPEEGWDYDCIMELGRPEEVKDRENVRPEDPDADEIEFWQLWVPSALNDESEYPQEGGYHGQIVTVALEGCLSAGPEKFIRKPYPFFGPAWGPYNVCGAYVVPGHPIEISPLVSDALSVEALNDVDTAITKSDAEYKRFLATRNSKTDLAEILASIEHDGIANFPGGEDLSKDIQPVEVFGSTRWMHATRQARREALDRKSGVFQAMLGNTTAGTTATADTIADRGASTRSSQHITKNAASIQRLLMTVLWYMNASGSFRMAAGPDFLDSAPIDEPIRRALRAGAVEYVFQGGHVVGKDGKPTEDGWVDDFHRYALTIDVGSAALTAEQRSARDVAAMQQFLAVQITLAQMPFIDGAAFNQQFAAALGMPWLAQISKISDGQQIAAHQAVIAGGAPPEPPQQMSMTTPNPVAKPPAPGKMETKLNVTNPPATTPASKPQKFPQYGTKAGGGAQSGS